MKLSDLLLTDEISPRTVLVDLVAVGTVVAVAAYAAVRRLARVTCRRA